MHGLKVQSLVLLPISRMKLGTMEQREIELWRKEMERMTLNKVPDNGVNNVKLSFVLTEILFRFCLVVIFVSSLQN